jgi:hypothetical protein
MTLDEMIARMLEQARANAHGGRNDAGFQLACQLRDNQVPYSEAERIMREFQATAGTTKRAAKTTSESAKKTADTAKTNAKATTTSAKKAAEASGKAASDAAEKVGD